MYLTATSLKTYLMCPFKFKLAHIENLRRKVPKAILSFGTAIHFSIAKYYFNCCEDKANPVETFKTIWQAESETEYEYSNGDSHAVLMEQGQKMLKQWVEHPETPKEATTVEKERYIEIEKVPFWSTIDFTGEDGNLLLDWKTAASRYSDYKAKLDLQLTAYAYVLAETEKMPKKVGFGVLIKKKFPEVQYVFSTRTVEDFESFKKLILKVWNDINEQHFYKVSGVHCAWCDYLPLCMEEDGAESNYIIANDNRYSDLE